MPVKFEEDCVCLYRNGESHVFSKHEVEDAVIDGWKDAPEPVKAKAKASENAADAPPPPRARRRAAVAVAE